MIVKEFQTNPTNFVEIYWELKGRGKWLKARNRQSRVYCFIPHSSLANFCVSIHPNAPDIYTPFWRGFRKHPLEDSFRRAWMNEGEYKALSLLCDDATTRWTWMNEGKYKYKPTYELYAPHANQSGATLIKEVKH